MTVAERELHNRMIKQRESHGVASRMYSTPTPEEAAEEKEMRDYWREWEDLYGKAFKN